MIFVDPREGSKELIPLLGDLCSPLMLPFGDVMFHGNGPTGDILVGIEVKKVADLLQSEGNGKLAGHQLPGMLDDSDTGDGSAWLLTIGDYRTGSEGNLVVRGRSKWRSHRVGHRAVPIGYLEAFIIELQECGVRHKHVQTNYEAACWLAILQRWWAKPWDKHRAMRKTDKSGGVSLMPHLSTEVEQMVRTFQTLPGLGFERALAASEYFPNIEAAAAAEVSEWTNIPGIGKVLAGAIKRALQGKR